LNSTPAPSAALRFSLLTLTAAFALTSFACLLLAVDATIRRVPRLDLLLALSDPPVVASTGLAALCAWRAKGEHRRAALPLTMAAVALALVAVVVLGDLVLSYRAPHSALVPIWSSKPAGILADVGTLVGVAGAAWGARQLLLVQAKAWPPGLTPLLVIGLLAQLAFTVSGLLGRPPWPLRVGQALLFAAGAVSAGLAAAALRRTPR
jgi:hypothetical protein